MVLAQLSTTHYVLDHQAIWIGLSDKTFSIVYLRNGVAKAICLSP